MAGARTRHVAGASVGLTGLALVGVAVAHAVGRSLPLAGLALAGLGAAVGLALAVAGWLLARSGLDGRRALRVAGWNLLGVAVTGTTVGLALAYQSSVGPAVARPVLSGAVIVGVSAVAHVLVGYNDLKRIRAGELAAERRKLAVTNRVVRHDLRTQAQLLYGCADRAAATTGDADLAARIRESGDDLADLRRTTTLIQEVVAGETPTGRVAVGPLLEAVVADRREHHPDATVASSAPDGLAVVAPEALREAVAELVDNAVEHAGPEPVVCVTARSATGSRSPPPTTALASPTTSGRSSRASARSPSSRTAAGWGPGSSGGWSRPPRARWSAGPRARARTTATTTRSRSGSRGPEPRRRRCLRPHRARPHAGRAAERLVAPSPWRWS